MKQGFMLNPIDEFVEYIRKQVKDNGGYCLHAEKGDKKNKCPKYCKSIPDCPCGMYISDSSVNQQNNQ